MTDTPSHSIAVFIPELDNLIAATMAEWKIPGLAVAVVQEDKVALLRAAGHADREAGRKATTDTQFQIASLTKSFTATGLAVLADEGQLDWKRPVRDYIPEFRLHDPIASERVTVRDLLCHHSGLPRHDWIWLPGDRTPAQILAALPYLELSDDIRSSFQYSNLGYLVASLVAERVSGQNWADFIRTRLTDKLGMEVTFTAEALAASADAAIPYAIMGNASRRAKLWPVGTVAAGGMSCSIGGLAKWLRLHLGKGMFEGQKLLSAGLVEALQKPRVHVGPTEFAEYSDIHYGFGLRTHRYRGERVVWHGGGWTGTLALMMLLPERGLGVGVLANLGMVPNFAPHLLANYVIDRVCGFEPAPWFERFGAQRRKILAPFGADRQAAPAPPPPSRPDRQLAEYAGDYQHPGYGRIVIAPADGALTWIFRGMRETLLHRHDDIFELPDWPDSPGKLLPGRLAVSFFAGRDGNIESLAMPFEPMVKDIVFTRSPRPAA